MTASTNQEYPAPQTKTGALDAGFQSEETTPVIGREYPNVNIVEDILNASNADELIRDLAITKLPETGGDTLWASGYEIYDRFSKAYQTFFEGLTATFVGDGFIRAAEANPEKVKIYEKERGSPKNVGKSLSAVHPVVRTNPVTGWKSIFALGPFPKYINELHEEESAELLKKFRSVITENHDLQVRFKWRNKNDIAIWDNRSAFHSATFDYDDLGERFGNRAVGIGEVPYFDPNSRSRTEALVEKKVVAIGHEKNGIAKSETVSA
ncbi:unnamed protein product [Alternaria alternata]